LIDKALIWLFALVSYVPGAILGMVLMLILLYLYLYREKIITTSIGLLITLYMLLGEPFTDLREKAA
jgi:putative effector of murein hydrolase LrgA (UPF0299 family)